MRAVLVLPVPAVPVKLRLLFKCRADQSFVPVFIKVARPITGQIVLGLARGLTTMRGPATVYQEKDIDALWMIKELFQKITGINA